MTSLLLTIGLVFLILIRVIGVQSLLPTSITDLEGALCFTPVPLSLWFYLCSPQFDANGLTVIYFWSETVTPTSFSVRMTGESGEYVAIWVETKFVLDLFLALCVFLAFC